jgi:hypothetical protein
MKVKGIQLPLALPKSSKKKKKGNQIGKDIKNVTSGLAGPDYALALSDPFHPRAFGARVPDQYAFPTEVAHVTTSFTLNSDASGNVSACIFANPTVGLVAPSTSTSGSPEVVQCEYLNTSGTSVGTGAYLCRAVSLTTINSRFNDYRTVAVGVRLKPLVSYTNAPGKIHFASVIGPTRFSRNVSATVTKPTPTASDVYTQHNIPVDGTGHVASSIINLPVSGQMSMTELIEQGNLTARCVPVGPGAFTFHEAYGGSDFVDPDTMVTYYNGTNQSISSNMYSDYQYTSGWSVPMIRGIGLPASTAVLEVEVVYHLEGTPQLSVTGTSLNSAVAEAVVDIPRFHNALQRASKSPIFRLAASAALGVLSSLPGGSAMINAGQMALRLMGGGS